MFPKKSEMMDKLYGKETSQAVYDRCQELSPAFNKLVQEVVYDVLWKREGLPLIEKSLVTIITLITLNKEEQLRIHLAGFFSQGGTLETITQIINRMVQLKYISSPNNALQVLSEVNKEKPTSSTSLSPREQAIVDLVAHIAIGNNDLTKKYLQQLLETKMLSENDIENILLHELVYSGFPCAMNGFAILKTIKNS